MRKHKMVTTSGPIFSRVMPIVLAMTFLLVAATITIANAKELETKSQQTTPQVEGDFASLFDENPQFQRGRESLERAWIALEYGDDELALRFFAEAEKQFSKALETNPDDIPILMNHATAYLGLAEYELALEDFDKVLSLGFVYAPGYEGKALVYEEMGDSKKAQEMQEAADAIYVGLKGKEEIIPDKSSPAPEGVYYSTWYASNAKHNYTNRFTGENVDNAGGFGCGVTSPWKTNIENAVYFHLPWTTWSRTTQGLKCTGLCNWVNLNGNTQGYTNAPPFQGWTVPAGENYVLLIPETEVCLLVWAPVNHHFKVSAYSNY